MISKKNNKFLYILLAVLFLTSLYVFWHIAHETIYEKEDRFDLNIIAYHTAHARPGLVNTMRVITFFGSTWFLFAAYTILIGWLIVKKEYRYSKAIAIVGVSAWAASRIFKLIFQRDRPDVPLIKKLTNYSFPSGHSFSSFVFCSILAWLVWQTELKTGWKWLISVLLLLFTLSIGTSRIVLNVHYATDVIGGFTLGIMWVIIAWVIWSLLKPVPAKGYMNL